MRASYETLQGTTEDYRKRVLYLERLQILFLGVFFIKGLQGGSKGLRELSRGDTGLQRVTGDYKGLQWVTRGTRRLQGVTWGGKG